MPVRVDLMRRCRRASDGAGEEQRTPVVAITPAFADTRPRGHERRMKRVRQEQGDVGSAQRIRPAPRQHHDVVDLTHEREQRRHRRARRHDERRAGPAVAHVGNRGQRHHGVAQPVRRDHYEAFHGGLIVSMKIALLQINPIVGDLTGNSFQIANAAREAQQQGADLAVSPELALAGYLPRDLLLSEGFISRCWDEIAALARTLANGPAVLVGLPEPNPSHEGRPLFNTAALLHKGRIGQRFRKSLLPTYDVFDEDRYFEPFRGPEILEICSRRLGISICEDVWNDRDFWKRRRYHFDPIQELARAGAQAIINLSASPFVAGKYLLRERMLGSLAAKHKTPVLYVNQVGGNDDLVFDGHSCAFSADGHAIARARAFAHDILIVDLERQTPLPPFDADENARESEVWEALVLGTRDYVRKCGFKSVVLGLSGGVDSALTAAIAAEAVGPDKVLGVLMPSPYSSQGSVDDARELAKQLGIATETLPIEPAMQAMEGTLNNVFRGTDRDVTEENIQARIRGNMLMAL